MFMVSGNDNVVRVNGRAHVSVDPTLIVRFEQRGKRPTTLIVITIQDIYFQCARALVRSKLWTGAAVPDLPTAGDFLRADLGDADFDGAAYDTDWSARATRSMW